MASSLSKRDSMASPFRFLGRGRRSASLDPWLEALVPDGEQVSSPVPSVVNGGEGVASVGARGLYLQDGESGETATVRWDEVATIDLQSLKVTTVTGDEIVFLSPPGFLSP